MARDFLLQCGLHQDGLRLVLPLFLVLGTVTALSGGGGPGLAPGPATLCTRRQSSADMRAPGGSLLGCCPCPPSAPGRASSYCDIPRPAPLIGTPHAGPGRPCSTRSPEVPRNPSCHPALHTRTLSQPGAASGPGPGSLPSNPFPPPPGPSRARLPHRMVSAHRAHAGTETRPGSQCCPGPRRGSALDLGATGSPRGGHGKRPRPETGRGSGLRAPARGVCARMGAGVGVGNLSWGLVKGTELPRALL